MSSHKLTQRRTLLLGLSASTLTCLWPGAARAGAATPASLRELLEHSQFALVGTPRQADSQWEGRDKARRIVTYSRVEVQQPIDGRHPDDSSLTVRTLGGRVGDVGQIVHGEAELELNQAAVFFLASYESGLFAVTAMAQGHYPLFEDSEGIRRLQTSPRLSDFLHKDPNSAASRLRGHTLLDTERMVLKELDN